jgi:hypothetical protein
MEATWYKLKDGTWGVKIRHDGQTGEEVAVTNKKGETRRAWLNSRIAKFDDAQLWSVDDEEPDLTGGLRDEANAESSDIEEPF